MIDPERPPTEHDPEEVREELRKAAMKSTYVMAKAVLGFRDLCPKPHLDMCQFIEAPSVRKLGLAPRDHLKTSVWTIADTVRRITCDPNIRILLANETATNASHFLRRIEAVFERNVMYKWLFPELIPDFSSRPKWSETEMQVPRSEDFPESTVEAIVVGGAVVSRHYNIIKLDDLVGKEASESDEVMRKTIDWYVYCESLLVRPRDPIHTYGTRWAYQDLYSWILQNEPDAEVFHRRAIDEVTGEALWPERFDFEALESIRQKMGTFKFSCQYLNKPYDPEATSFDERWLRYYDFVDGMLKPDIGAGISPEATRRFMLVDPAISESNHAARTAVVVVGVSADGRKWVLDIFAERCQPSGMFEAIFNLNRRWDVECVAVEAVAYQKAIRGFLLEEAERRGEWLNVIEVRPDSKQRKESRIRGLQPFFERGELFVRRDQTMLLEEYRTFPVGATVDILDALAYGPQVWSAPEDDKEAADDGYVENWMQAGRSQITGY